MLILNQFFRESTLWLYYITKKKSLKDQFMIKVMEGNLLFDCGRFLIQALLPICALIFNALPLPARSS